MPISTVRNKQSGQVKFAQEWELDSYLDKGWEVDESATQDADGINKNPDSRTPKEEPKKSTKKSSKK